MDPFLFIILLVFGLPAFFLGYIAGREHAHSADNYTPSPKEILKYQEEYNELLRVNNTASEYLRSIMGNDISLVHKSLNELAMLFSNLKMK